MGTHAREVQCVKYTLDRRVINVFITHSLECVRAHVCGKMKEKCRVFSIIKRELHCGAPKACEKLNSMDSNCPISTSKEKRH